MNSHFALARLARGQTRLPTAKGEQVLTTGFCAAAHRSASVRQQASTHNRQLSWLTAALFLSGCLSDGWAQGVDAGRVYDSLQKSSPKQLPAVVPKVQLKPSAEPADLAPVAGAQVEVKQFRIEGARLLQPNIIAAAVQPFSGRTLTVVQLQEAAAAVTQVYRDAGYILARAVVLPQSIQDGIITITVQEGRVDKLSIVGAQNGSEPPRVVQDGIRQSIRTTEAINSPALEETLLLINNLPSRGRSSAEISPGLQGDGTSVNVSYAPSARVGATLQADNAGSRYTGRNRLFTQFFANDPLGLADQASLGVFTTGSLLSSVQAGYRVPFGLRTSVGVSASVLRYKLCCLNAGQSGGGDVGALAIDASYTLRSRRDEQVGLFAIADTKRLETDSAGAQQTQRTVSGATAGARGFWTGAAYNAWSASLRAGKANLAGNAADLALDAAGTRVQGRFAKFNANYFRSQALNSAWSWQLNLRGQGNLGRNLESSERIVLGGSDGVRAYPSGEAVGDTAWLATLELRYLLAQVPGLSATVFADTGGVRRFSKNAAVLAGATPNNYQLSGLGLGLRYDTEAVNLSLVVAKPVGSNRGLDALGNNSDGSKDGPRAWLTAAWRF